MNKKSIIFNNVSPLDLSLTLDCGQSFRWSENPDGSWHGVVRGKSVDALIENGDLVIVRQQDTAEEGQIVVALIENEATLKRYYIDKRRHKVRLHPENDEMKDMYFDEVSIQGVAVKILKDIH